jgi:hypothetical protein
VLDEAVVSGAPSRTKYTFSERPVIIASRIADGSEEERLFRVVWRPCRKAPLIWAAVSLGKEAV